MKEYKLEQFSGPLDLLLNLINEEKLNISDVSLSAVTEQFLNYLEKLENKKPEELTDFLVIATRLLLIKSRKLLPQFAPEEEEWPCLEEQLRLYRMFVEAAKKFNHLWEDKNYSVFRIEPPRRPEKFTPPENLSSEVLHQSMADLLKRLRPLEPLPQTQIDRTVLLEEKVKTIHKLLRQAKSVNFSNILNDAKNRTEIIVTFLALLELMKSGDAAIKQRKSFEEIVVESLV